MQTRIIDVEHAIKSYGSGAAIVHAVRGVSMHVNAGEILFLTGPSGSGKTTLLSLLGCVLTPTSGLVRILGIDIAKASARQLQHVRLYKLGFVFQGHNLIASLTALENVRLPLLLQGVSFNRANVQAEAMLSQVGLANKLQQIPANLSGGQKQRVAIARALIGNPQLLLADEPTASLDATSGQEVMQLLVQLAKQAGHTVVVVTHDNRIFHYADRMIAMEDGRMLDETNKGEH